MTLVCAFVFNVRIMGTWQRPLCDRDLGGEKKTGHHAHGACNGHGHVRVYRVSAGMCLIVNYALFRLDPDKTMPLAVFCFCSYCQLLKKKESTMMCDISKHLPSTSIHHPAPLPIRVENARGNVTLDTVPTP